ncbi:hypothetical protein ROBYS_12070 [Roseobacter sp. OBYS 0001]|nr:hypothetical protein ROBYS_12070 [Roseobacter sp. OBYS 0001]
MIYPFQMRRTAKEDDMLNLPSAGSNRFRFYGSARVRISAGLAPRGKQGRITRGGAWQAIRA